MPLVSVVMPVYNTAAYVWPAIDSILAQTFVDLELMIIDDGSTDESWEIIQQYAAQDDRIQAYQHPQNLGISATRTRLIALATTQYIASQDSDDISHPRRLEECFEFLGDHPEYAVVSGHNQIIDSHGKVLGIRTYSDDIHYRILKKSPLSQPSSMYRKEVYLEVWGYDPDLDYGEDYDLRCKMYAAGHKIKNLDTVLVDHRIRDGQTKSTHLKQTLKNTLAIQRTAVSEYRMMPSWSDQVYRWGEHMLLLLPSSLLSKLFQKITYTCT